MLLEYMFGALRPGFMLVGPIGWSELLIILVIVLIFFGPKRLPDLAESLGRSIQKFKKASRDAKSDIEDGIKEDKDKLG